MFLADGAEWVELVVSVAISLLSLLLYICYPFPVSICRFVEYPLCFAYIPMGPPDLRTLVTQQTDQVRRSTKPTLRPTLIPFSRLLP